MNKTMRSIMIMAALAVILVIGVVAQQKSGDTAIDPVCGMTVVKATAKATFEFKGTTYYFCSPGCKEAFAKEPEKYLKAQAKVEGTAAPMGMMHGAQMGKAPMPEGAPMAGCPMMARRMPMRGRMGRMGRMGMMPGGMGMRMHGGMGMEPGMAMGMACGPDCPLLGADVEMTVEKTKDGVTLKVTAKDAETVKAIQEHMTEHVAMMKKMKDEAAKAPEEACCANCPMKKEVKK
ncbi:MAG: YHS domain-containing protein [Candidatus Aminicenantes bacterium]|nr:YHS domain-containing protein [Candidatus Aminicenantes bacterium]